MSKEREAWIKEQDLTPIIEAVLAGVPRHKDYQVGFEQRLYERWKEPLDLYEATLVFGQELAAKFNQFVRPHAVKQQDFVFDVLVKLHIRACQTGSAILSLLKSGHANTALASARTLHELHVTAKFINMHGNDAAERYLLYKIVELLRAAHEIDRHCLQMGIAPLESDTIPLLEQLLKQYRTKFSEKFAGRVMKGFYGWAVEDLNFEKRTPTFEDIEKTVGLASLRPYYKQASYPVHASAKGLTFTLGKIGSFDLVPAGASNAGLADAASMALFSFYECTALLLRYPVYTNEPTLKKLHDEMWLMDKALNKLLYKTQEAFQQTQQLLEEDELLIQAEEQDNPNRRFVYKYEE